MVSQPILPTNFQQPSIIVCSIHLHLWKRIIIVTADALLIVAKTSSASYTISIGLHMYTQLSYHDFHPYQHYHHSLRSNIYFPSSKHRHQLFLQSQRQFTSTFSIFQLSLLVISRVIHLHHIIFHSRPLSLVSKSLPMCSLFHLDHNRTFNVMVFVSTIRNEMSTIPTIHRSIRRQVNQQSTTFIWLK